MEITTFFLLKTVLFENDFNIQKENPNTEREKSVLNASTSLKQLEFCSSKLLILCKHGQDSGLVSWENNRHILAKVNFF